MKVNEMSDWEQVGKIKQEQSEENYMNIVVKSLKGSIRQRQFRIETATLKIDQYHNVTMSPDCTAKRLKDINERIIPKYAEIRAENEKEKQEFEKVLDLIMSGKVNAE